MFTKALLLVAGLLFVAIGSLSLVAPQLAADAVGLNLVTVDSVNEVRANYGGMHLFMGLFYLAAVFRSAWRLSAVRMVAVFTGGLVAGRLLGLLLGGMEGVFLWAFLALEIVAVAWALAVLARGVAPGDGIRGRRQPC